ncbi:MAG: glycosyl hydrolase family 28 protein [Mariniphaga sp.]
MNKIINISITLMLFSLGISFTLFAKEYNITSFGAKSDTSILSTSAIQSAIDQCNKDNGGKVIIPSGAYRSGTIYLKSNVTLYLEKGATLYGSTQLSDYPENFPDYTFFRKGEVKRALIYAENCSDIAIEGEGIINGQGEAFWIAKGSKADSYGLRPYLIWMIQCRNIRTEGVKLRNSALWMQHYLACDQVYIHNIDVFNHCNKNNDMIDIDGCHDVRISDIVGDSDDDGITLKSTSGRGNENIVITNCVLSSHCNALKMGTESNTGFKNVAISNIVIRPSKVTDNSIEGTPKGHTGIALEEVDGGILDGIVISNLRIDGPNCPIFIRLGNRNRPYFNDQKIENNSVLQNVSITNVIATGASMTGCSITGTASSPVRNITLSHIMLEFEGGGTRGDLEREIPEMDKSYPEADMFDILPSYGLFIRHGENIQISNIQLKTKSADMRPALMVSDVNDSNFENLSFSGNSNNTSDIFLEKSRGITISKCSVLGGSNSLVNFKGNSNARITLLNNDLTNVKLLYPPGQNLKNGILEIGNLR